MLRRRRRQLDRGGASHSPKEYIIAGPPAFSWTDTTTESISVVEDVLQARIAQ